MNRGVTVLIPVYQGENYLQKLVSEILSVFPDDCRELEILLIDDGSHDRSWDEIVRLSRIHPSVRGVRLDRNFGQQNALCCGFTAASFPVILTMDDDLQHDPREMLRLLDALDANDLDVVYGIPQSRHFPWYRNWGSRITYHLFELAMHKPKGLKIGSFRAIRGELARTIASESRGFVYVSAATFRHTKKVGSILVQNGDKPNGSSSYTFPKLLRLFFNLLLYHTELPLLAKLRSQDPIFVVSDKTPERLLIAGAGSCQVNAIRRAQNAGISVIAADYLPDSPGKAFADFSDLSSTFDREGISNAALRYGADGIMTLGTDQPVLTCAQVASELGFPSFLNPIAGLRLTNKKTMKLLLREKQIPMAPFLLMSSPDPIGIPFPFPVVIKPLDSQGQRGVFLCKDPDELVGLFSISQSYSRENELMVEAFYPSDEITVSGWVSDRKLTILTVTDRLTFSAQHTIGICYGHRFPTKFIHEYGEEILTISDRIVAAVPIENGPIYIQMLIGSSGLVVNEIAGRLGGAYEDLMIPLLTGFDPLAWSISAVLGREWDCARLENYEFLANKMHGFMELFFISPGRISSMTSMEELKEKLPFIEFGQHYCKVGDEAPVIDYAGQRAGHLFYRAESADDLECRRRAVYENLKILDETGRNLVLYRSSP